MTEQQLWKIKPLLPLMQADVIIHGALKAARSQGMEPMTVAVLDTGGHLIALKREDGSGILRVQIALGKGWGALGMGAPSRLLRDRLSDRLGFVAALTDASDGRFVPVPGGVLVLDQEDYILGAVGISGDTSERDELCAINGIQGAGLRSQPEEADSNWQTSIL
tara:strand:- start:80 stop:571 length:492 start_codon:yes stop_codon:yes gene_type:complete